MTTWTSEELSRIGKADELKIASLRPDGTLRNMVTIWVVRVADDLYVRAVNGRTGLWFRHAQERHEGHIQAGGVNKDVTFEEADSDRALNDQIDGGYRSKYGYSSSPVTHITSAAAKAATIRLVPR
jgi:hypothetical protein